MADLGTLPGGSNSSAQAINASGMIVGRSEVVEPGEEAVGPGGGCIHATLWTNQVAVDLGTLGDSHHSGAYAINDLGQIVGLSEDRPGGGCVHAILWSPGTQGYALQDLGTLGGENSVALGINNQGLVVGLSETPDGDVRAFTWTASGGMTPLPGGPRHPQMAFGVNSKGGIVGADAIHAGQHNLELSRWSLTFRTIDVEHQPAKKAVADDWSSGSPTPRDTGHSVHRFDASLWELAPNTGNPPPPGN